MLKLILILAILTVAADRQIVGHIIGSDTLKVAKTDTMTIIKHEDVKTVTTLRDTIKLVKSDTTRTITYDTVVAVKRVPKPVKK